VIATRRGLITGLTSLVVAPAIVRASNLMPISVERLLVYTNDFGVYNYIGPHPSERGHHLWKCLKRLRSPHYGDAWATEPGGSYSFTSLCGKEPHVLSGKWSRVDAGDFA
jgi:hypothetical protein